MTDEDDSDVTIDEEFLRTMEEVFITSYMVHGPEDSPDIPDDVNPGYILGPIRIARLNLELGNDLAATVEDFQDRNERLQEEIPQASLTEGHMEAQIAQRLSNRLFGYFALASALIEQYSVELLQNELFLEQYHDTRKTNRLLRRSLNQKVRESFLLRTGVIDGGLHSDLTSIREFRNDMVHDPEYRLFLKRGEEIPDDLHIAFEAVQELAEMVVGEHAFTFDLTTPDD